MTKEEKAIILLSKHIDTSNYKYGAELEEALTIIANAIRQQVERPKGKWIPVSERLPEESGYYLVNVFIEDCYFSEVCVRWFAHPDDYSITAGEWRECADDELVTAWMPLPKPYKAESEVEE